MARRRDDPPDPADAHFAAPLAGEHALHLLLAVLEPVCPASDLLVLLVRTGRAEIAAPKVVLPVADLIADEQLDFPVVYASAQRGFAGLDSDVTGGDMRPLFVTIVQAVAPPPVNIDGPFQMRVSSLDYSSYVGVIGIGRVQRGSVKPNQQICVLDVDGHQRNARVLQVLGFHGLERVEVPAAQAGDIIAITGVENLQISDTLCDRSAPEALPALTVDEPTISMTFRVNNSPFAGREGKYLTSRQLRERLMREASHNVALRVEDTARVLRTLPPPWTPRGAGWRWPPRGCWCGCGTCAWRRRTPGRRSAQSSRRWRPAQGTSTGSASAKPERKYPMEKIFGCPRPSMISAVGSEASSMSRLSTAIKLAAGMSETR